jgi:tRNA A-37 threonylcarbamoyl transferase component Bud32
MKKIGKYEIVRQLGKGATSAVFLARDPFSAREVAVKVVYPEVLGDKEYGRRYRKLFVTEASLAGMLSHPHIVAIYDAAVEDRASYIVMEYVSGGTLERHTMVDQLLPMNKVLEIAFKCCKALDYAYRNGVIHRDIKPANILLTESGDIKISDFGAALIDSTESTQVSGVGSPAYMSPQQLKEQPLTHQTDIFALGVVLYQLFTGHLPFRGANKYAMIYQIINSEPPPPSTHRPEIPPRLDQIVLKALGKDLDLRYQTWDEFARDLADAFGDLRKAEAPIPDMEKFYTLRRLKFFKTFTDVELWEVVRIGTWVRRPAGAVLIREGDEGSAFYVVASGDVKVTKGKTLLATLGSGDSFGEMGHLSKRPFRRSASVTAVTDVTVVEVGVPSLAGASDGCRGRFNAVFLETLVERLSTANDRLADAVEDRDVLLL